MAYDLEEQEQLESLKAWWKKHGNWITWVLIAVLGCYAVYAYWGYYQRKQTAQASQLYYEMQNAVMSDDNERALRVAKDTQEKFGRTAYAPMVTLVAAKMAYEENKIDVAKTQLQWVVDNAKQDGYKAIARLRLAGILLDEKAYDEGLKLLSAGFPEPFVGLAEDRKGDFLVAQNKLDDARTAYWTALEKTSPDDPGRQLIQLKLEEIGIPPDSKG
ncbi:tetratricopeptide repeat protein [Oxalobacter aliiformigenes]|uniref:YfgM family protein n=1 Tax=Oxalobacter aliiformigenes TaxID=2946593 RepID=UPI0022AF552B|nr:tetratricopeptide repeat protein [Oxalobacter aliiformigenes]MCZ4064017.1 tetratricopeptide repeat protein [Oxalobacter aliiformigenes]WAV99394.1 tetratricopeptide repeat protein [Oxalobacter aliiformigenes]